MAGALKGGLPGAELEEGEEAMRPDLSEADEKRIRRLERMTADYWRQVTRTGGTYIPPSRMQKEDKPVLPNSSSEAFQRLAWDALRRSLNGLVNKVNGGNIREVVRELFRENLVRGRGLFARTLLKTQMQSPLYTPVYAAMVAVVNSRLPEVGGLIVARCISAFRKAYRRNDKEACVAGTTMLAHLANQRVVHELCVLQALLLLLERPTDDSVEIAVALTRACGPLLLEVAAKPANAIFERFRAILHEGTAISRRVQYMVEVLFQLRKDAFGHAPILSSELDLLDEDDRVIHNIMLDDELDTEEASNVFRFDPSFKQSEQDYDLIRKEILGSDDEQEDTDKEPAKEEPTVEVKDLTEADLVSFRKTVYLTIMSSVDFEECGHKLLKLQLSPQLQPELVTMMIECCANERTYLRFFGQLAERFCRIDPTVWQAHFEQAFRDLYDTVHRLQTERLRNVARLFGHLLESDAISWAVLEIIHLTERDTTSAGRIFVKFLMMDLVEFFGIPKVKECFFGQPEFQPYFAGIFPADDTEDLCFSVNFFTAIGLGGLVDQLRAKLLKDDPSLNLL